MSRARIVYALAFCVSLVAGRGCAESLPDCGKGLVLFSVAAGDAAALPPYLKLIAGDGWKVEVRPVVPSYAREREFAVALRGRIDAARQAGCARIALVGESFGAWISLLANASFQTPIDSESVQAVVAIDASAAKSEAPRDTWHDYKFVNLLKVQDATHLVVFLYDAPAEEVGERKGEISRSLANRVRDARVIAETAAYDGAEGPHGEVFARRYGPLLIEMLDGPAPVGLTTEAPARK